MNGGQGGGFPPPAGGQWPGDASGGTPYGGHDPYAGPAYGGQGSYGGGYGAQQQGGIYGDPYAQTPSYGPGGPMGPGGMPPKKSRAGLIVALAVGASIVVFGGIATVIGVASTGHDEPVGESSPTASSSAAGGGGHTLTVPQAVGPYHRMTGSVAKRLADNMRKSMGQADASGKYADVYAKSRIAIYSKNGDPASQIVFVGMSADDSSEMAKELRSQSPSEVVDSTFLGMGLDDTKDYPAGPLGGVLRCGTGSIGQGNTAAACAWADRSTVGMLITPLAQSPSALARTTVDLRNAAEH